MADNDTIDDYELINCIATGNATQVWEVKRAGNAQSQAMKLLLPEAFKEAEAKRNLKHEATVGKSLEHPNIIKIFELKMTRKEGYFIMEYFRGANLKGMIRNERAATQAKAKKLMECLSQALGYMHDKNWIHKDIKPDNVLLTKAGEVRLIDFSLASRPGSAIVHAVSRKKSIQIQGTRTYLAPELIRRERLTPAADIYSLGVLLFEILTGNPPFRTANANDLLMMHVRDKPPAPSEIEPNVSPEADQLVLKMLSKQLKDRHQSMHEVFSEVRQIRLFKEDPLDYAHRIAEEEKQSAAAVENDRLNSRLDAERTAQGIVLPKPKPKPKPKPTLPPEKPVAKKPKAGQPAAQAPPQQGYPGGQPPMGYPGMQFPGYPMQPGMPMPFPGYPGMPGQPMGGYPGMPQGMPYPGMMPGQFPPGQFPPGQFPPGQQMPGPGQGMPQQPGGQGGGPKPTPRPAAPAPKPSEPPKKKPVEEDLPIASLDDLDIE